MLNVAARHALKADVSGQVQIAKGNACGISEGPPGARNQPKQDVTPASHALDEIAPSPTFNPSNYVRVLRREPYPVPFAIDPFTRRRSLVLLRDAGPVEPARHLPIAWPGWRPEMKSMRSTRHSALDAMNFLSPSIGALELHSK